MFEFLPEILKPVIFDRNEYSFFPFLAKTFHHAFYPGAHCNSFLIRLLHLHISGINCILKEPSAFFRDYLNKCGFSHKVSCNAPVTAGTIRIIGYLNSTVSAAFTPSVPFFLKLIDSNGVLFPVLCLKNWFSLLDLFAMDIFRFYL